MSLKAKKLVLITSGAVIVALIGTGSWWFLGRTHNPIPSEIRNSVSFPLYYPTAEPRGYALNTTSFRNSGGTIFYDLSGSGGHSIIVSQQAPPKNFDPKEMFAHNPLPTTISSLGTIYDLSYKNQSRYMLVATNSLVFISSTPKISNAQLKQIIDGLKVSN